MVWALAMTAGTKRLPCGLAVACEPGQPNPGRPADGQEVFRIGNLQHRLALSAGGQALQDPGNRGPGCLVAGQEDGCAQGWRVEVDSAVQAVVTGIRAEQRQLVTDPNILQPKASRAAPAFVHHEVDVHFGHCRPHVPHGVSADRVALMLGQRSPAGVPVRADRQR
jgi:hypothetical protein